MNDIYEAVGRVVVWLFIYLWLVIASAAAIALVVVFVVVLENVAIGLERPVPGEAGLLVVWVSGALVAGGFCTLWRAGRRGDS